jgi:ABC-type multidrug transport system ATPase subunit
MSEMIVSGEYAGLRSPPEERRECEDAAGAWDVRTRRVWKTFGPLAALRGISLVVPPGERLAIVGPNGSGKSTFLKVLATLLRPSAGTALLGGLDVRGDAAQLRRHIGVVSHHTFLYRDLTARENLEFYARLYRLSDPSDRALWQLRLLGLEKQRDTLASDLSRGMQQRLSLARALLHDPALLLLDEPDTGLDQRWSAFLTDLVANAARDGRTIVITTHNLERSLDLSDRVVVLNAGKIVFSADRNELDAGSLRENYARYTGATV